MMSTLPERSTQEKRPALWKFKTLGTIRKEIIQIAGRIIYPQGKLTLSMATNDAAKDQTLDYLDKISKAA